MRKLNTRIENYVVENYSFSLEFPVFHLNFHVFHLNFSSVSLELQGIF